MSRFFSVHLFRGRLPWLVAGVLGLVITGWWGRGYFRRTNPLLEAPVLLLEQVQGRPLYYNGPAFEWLRLRRPDLLAAEDRAGVTKRTQAFAQAVLAPQLFRQLDREQRFEALLLVGDASQYRGLLDHLAETKDWSLSYVDNWGMIFRRGGVRAWKMEDLQPVRARFARSGARDRAMFLAQTGVKLAAAREFNTGRQLLDEAVQVDRNLPDAWSGLASYYLQRAEYGEALKAVDRALEIEQEHLPALATKSLLLFGTRRFAEAYEISSKVIARLPDDPNLLFYHAKISHEAHAYQAEIEALQKLISRADDEERPVSGYQLYLAQAYTAAGEAKSAIDAFMNVLNDPDLPQDQRDFARESIVRIKQRAGL
ncbi:MAG: hypothetical protein K8R23_18110 [Chthoniobacter sp.]|nr:hypothetical protein [Chthoniobacter sp.]